MAFDVKTVTVSTGMTLPYIETGDANGVPVIFLHGLSDSHRSFEPLLEVLPKRLRSIALTQRGHGDASRPEGDYRPEDMAGDVAAFMDALKIERAVIAGHSMGSLVARAFVHAHPERTLGLVLIGAFATVHNNPGVIEFWNTVDCLTDPVPPDFVRDFQVSTIAVPVPETFLEMVIDESLKLPSCVWRAATAGMIERDYTFTGSGTLVPTLILYGDKDVFVPRADQDVLVAAFRNSRFNVYIGTGHAVHWEMPARVATDLSMWLRQVEHAGVRHAA
jgi:pimeloyl-ACP methyl ester carboxylesterase